MRIDPKNPNWEERDRFILSKGHAAPALYAVLLTAQGFHIFYPSITPFKMLTYVNIRFTLSHYPVYYLFRVLYTLYYTSQFFIKLKFKK